MNLSHPIHVLLRSIMRNIVLSLFGSGLRRSHKMPMTGWQMWRSKLFQRRSRVASVTVWRMTTPPCNDVWPRLCRRICAPVNTSEDSCLVPLHHFFPIPATCSRIYPTYTTTSIVYPARIFFSSNSPEHVSQSFCHAVKYFHD